MVGRRLGAAVGGGASMHGETGVFDPVSHLHRMKSFTKLSGMWIAAGKAHRRGFG